MILIRKITYALDENFHHIRDLYVVFIEAECICECYTETFQHLSRSYWIICMITRSSDYEWNFVQINDDKKWYVDITWND